MTAAIRPHDRSHSRQTMITDDFSYERQLIGYYCISQILVVLNARRRHLRL
jgi:hypothetical protein